MGAKEILIAMNESGLDFSLAGEVLRATPKERLTDEHRLLIRQHKPELVALLKAMAEPDHQGFFPGGTDSTEQATVPPWGMSETQPATDGTPFDPDFFFEERAAIIAHEGGIPREWAEGVREMTT